MHKKKINVCLFGPESSKLKEVNIALSENGSAQYNFVLPANAPKGEFEIVVDWQVKKFNVGNYKPSKYKVKIETDKPYYAPGELVKTEICIKDLAGNAISNAKIRIDCMLDYQQNPFKRDHYEQDKLIDSVKYVSFIGKTDLLGKFETDFKLPEDFDDFNFSANDSKCELKAKIILVDEPQIEVSKTVPVSARPIQVSCLQEYSKRLWGIEDDLIIRVYDPTGKPLQADVKFEKQRFKCDDNGLLLIKATNEKYLPLEISLGKQKLKPNIPIDFYSNHEADIMLRTDKAVYNIGETIEFDVCTELPEGRVFINIVKGDKTLTMLPVSLTGKQTFKRFKIPENMFGTIQLHAYRFIPDGEFISEMRLIQIKRPEKLFIKHSLKSNRLNLTLCNEKGKAVDGAFSVAVLDQNAPLVSQREYFMLQKDLLKGKIQLQANKLLTSKCPVLKHYILDQKYHVGRLECNHSKKFITRVNDFIAFNINVTHLALKILLPIFLILFAVLLLIYLAPLIMGPWEDCVLVVPDNLKRKISFNIMFAIMLYIVCSLDVFLLANLIRNYSIDLNPIQALFYHVKLIGGFLIYVLCLGYFLYRSFHLRKCLLGVESNVSKYIKVSIFLSPCIALLFILVSHLFIAAYFVVPSFYESNIVQYALWVIPVPILLWLYGALTLKEKLITQVDYEKHKAIQRGLGAGMGAEPRTILKTICWGWLACPLIGLIILYGAYFLVYYVLMLPMFMTGGGLSGWRSEHSFYSEASYWKVVDNRKYFVASGLEEPEIYQESLPDKYYSPALVWISEVKTDKNGNAVVDLKSEAEMKNYKIHIGAVSSDGHLTDKTLK